MKKVTSQSLRLVKGTMLTRQKIILATLHAAGRNPSKIELMKWLFLMRKESELAQDSTFYDFVPYKFGPFSFTVYQDLNYLIRDGYLAPSQDQLGIELTETVASIVERLPAKVKAVIQGALSKYSQLSIGELIDYVYDNYPWYATRSQLRPSAVGVRTPSQCAVYTSGYEGKSIDRFLERLLNAGIECIIDVRNNPMSRKYGFSKVGLSRCAERLELEYIHIGELGIPSELRRSLHTKEDYEVLFQEYETTVMPSAPEACDRAAELMTRKPSTLVCFEADASRCHRGKLADLLARQTGLEVVHL